MITSEKDIKPIPKYMLKLIKKEDLKYYPKPDGHTRFYTYFTKLKNELACITVAVRNKYRKWYCKQVIVHGIHSPKAWVQDIGISMGYYQVGWYREQLSKYEKWYDYDWGYLDDKYFNKEAPIINKEYILSIPKYKYSAIDCFQTSKHIMDYLRTYEKHPKAELLVKCGLYFLATSKQILNKCEKDKNFCKWLYKNTENIKCYYYKSSIIKAYNSNKDIEQTFRLDESKRQLKRDGYFNHLKTVFQNDLDDFIQYLKKQYVSASMYQDYLSACEYLNLDMTLSKNRYPHDFRYWHDLRINEYNSKKAEQDAKLKKELYSKFAKVAKKYAKLERKQAENYAIIIPTSPKDLVNEGNILHHCVGSMGYDKKFADEKSLIFFIRDINKLDEPLATLEYSLSNHKILQCYADSDSTPDNNILHFVNKIWLPYANKKIKRIV